LGALKKDRKLFTEVQWKRACHVISENIRVRETAEAFRFYNFNTVGKLLAESHESLKEDYEVTCKEVDFLVEKALSVSGVYGARMTGGGFGGCIIVLLRKESIREYKTSLKAYQEKFNKKAEFYTAVPSDGVHFI
jgi:galactokinase